MSETQDLYEDSDLAPLSDLFREMGNDRSFWRKVKDSVDFGWDAWKAISSRGVSLFWESGRDSFTPGKNEADKELANIGQTRDRFTNSADNAFFIKLTSFRKSQMDHLKDEKNRAIIFEKIALSGLLGLAEEAGGVREFARLRFENEKTLRQSASNFNDPTRDTVWLERLIQAKDYFYRDPLALATVYKFFPNLYKLFITALAASADYGYSEEDPLNNHKQIVEQMFKSFGTDKDGKSVFEPVWAIENFTTAQKIEKAIKETAIYTNTPPVSPDIFHLRIGAANFYVPPVTINVNTGFKTGSLTGGAIRQKASPKFNSGHRETTISLKLYFPNYEEIWGISIDDATKINLNSNYYLDFKDSADENKIDKFLSSLRGLIAAFKYAPILPIKNHYLNSVFDISGVALIGMTISTVPNYPFTLEVDLELANFNHKPYLPMIKDFNQAVHWGKFRYYMGRAAGSLANAVNAEFLLNSTTEKKAPLATDRVELPSGEIIDISENITEPYKDGVLTTNVINDWIDGKNISLYIPSEVQSKIFTPDISMFRSEEEKAAGYDHGRSFWENLLYQIGIINVTDMTLYRNLDTVIINSLTLNSPIAERQKVARIVEVALAGVNAKNVYEQLYDVLVVDYINSNNIKDPAVIDYLKNRKSPNEIQVPAQETQELTNELRNAKTEMYNAAQSTVGFLKRQIEKNTENVLRRKKLPIDKNSKEWKDAYAKEEQKFADAFTSSLYERVMKDEAVQNLLGLGLIKEANLYSGIDGRNYSAFNIREWEVPMMKIDLDQNSVIVNSVSLSMGNNMAKLQLQMQEEPTFQYIGSKDSVVSISMTVFGETELIKIRKMFDYLSGLARLEKAAGVIGFMGIKNIVCALAGIKYVLPLNYSVQTIEGFPHVYNVNLMLVDFDIFQQKRENISSEQQISMIKEFGSKRNPFLRLKQKWGAFNAYPDLPLSISNSSNGEYVGSLDPDFYFRSFEMYDNDVVNNIIDPDNFTLPIVNSEEKTNKLDKKGKTIVYDIKKKLIENNGNVESIKKYLLTENMLSPTEAMNLLTIALYDQQNEPEFLTSLGSSKFIANKYPDIWKDFVTSVKSDDTQFDFDDVKFNTRYGNIRIGDIVSGSKSEVDKFNKLITESANADGKTVAIPSFDPDDVDHFGLLQLVPAADQSNTRLIPGIYQTPDGGYVLGNLNTEDGRFYLSQEYLEFSPDGKLTPRSSITQVSDTQTPEREKQSSHTGIPGAKSLDSYQYAYASPETDKMQSVSSGGSHKGVAKHWQKMMMDTQYRDLSGRMIRAYPTYMLWLIDDSNFFAGVKLFDNFYGLQSIIDFSIVQSEDILGDTLMLRVSNTYSKLSKPEATLSSIVSLGYSQDGGMTSTDFNSMASNLSEGTARVIQTLLNRSMNLKSHMNARYVTEIAQMRLKPGVRVHLRAGYGANPNSLQTIFNGVVTEVDHGEILTIVAQSDAVELSPIINSTNKKGDSGKIDGGINTGLWLSEPRDLMVRLLSMGASRVREAFAHATRGAVFSENKFGIRHFGSILYEPLTEQEQARSSMYRQAVINAFNSIAKNPVGGTMGIVWNSGMNLLTGGIAQSAGGSVRTPIVGAMQAMWANFSTQRDLEIYKRNIYPGNGVGVAQFLGGDLDDGWATMASVDISEIEREKFGYMSRLSDSSWSGLIQGSLTDTDASQVLERLTSGNKLVDSSRAVGTTQALIGASAGPGAALLMSTLGTGLLKSMHGRGTTNVMKTLGLVSDLDDDIYDEVSFRAQTYMRSVWDMFQMCAKLLPNYIVAVRPFEDRSTIFYGKPHWLYTSGIFPISTGFPNEEVAERDGIDIPQYLSSGESLNEILQSVKNDLSPIADANALAKASESSMAENVVELTKDMISFNGIFKAGSKLRGRVINFADTNRTSFYDKDKKIVSRLPVSKGRVQVGFHLPFGQKGVSAPIQMKEHQQIPLLPIRFRYPFFTNRTSGTLGSLDFDKIIKGSSVEDLNKSISNIVEISKKEKELINSDGETTALVVKKGDEYSLNFNFDFAQKLNSSLDLDDIISGTAAFDPSGINDPDSKLGILSASLEVQMPLPIRDYRDTEISDSVDFREPYQKYFDDLDPVYDLQQEFSSIKLDFTEWGMPKTAEEEQFYIAMRWPYNPIDAKISMGLDAKAAKDPAARELLKKFLKLHNLKEDQLVGNPEEYKKRRILVYNENTKSAVVCAPAYFLWGETEADDSSDGSNRIEAIISPDAAYFLGLLIDDEGRILSPLENIGQKSMSESAKDILDDVKSGTKRGAIIGLVTGGPVVGAIRGAVEGLVKGTIDELMGIGDQTGYQWDELGMVERNLPECRFTFVPDDTPLGVVTSSYNPANAFALEGDTTSQYKKEEDFLIGFGAFKPNDPQVSPDSEFLPAVKRDTTGGHPSLSYRQTGIIVGEEYSYSSLVELKSAIDYQKEWSFGGNYIRYYDEIRDNNLGELSQEKLIDKLNEDVNNRSNFAAVWDPIDSVSIVSRGFYDEDYDPTVKVIAGNGRTLAQAQDIWDQFRYGYHNYDSVKNIFQQVYELDPDDDGTSTDPLFELITGKDPTPFDDLGKDQFDLLLGADFLGQGGKTSERRKAVDIAMKEYVDGGFDGKDEEGNIIIDENKGIRDVYDYLVYKKVKALKKTVESHFQTYEYANTDQSTSSNQKAEDLLRSIKSPKQLFLLLVGIFRQKMWTDPYSRAWLVLSPDRKRFNPKSSTSDVLKALTFAPIPGGKSIGLVSAAFNLGYNQTDEWSFRSVDRAFHAFIDYNAEYASNDKNFINFLKKNAKEGSSSSNWVTGVYEDGKNFWDRNIGPIFSAFDAALGNLLNMFRLSMAQMGYGLSELENFSRQANILNKAYNDSIYYSLGRPGSLLRAVDNPFTREYGEPVVEVREPFQRMHYISSFSHILNNSIKENGNVATQITAVSDGRFPVTVSLDKSVAPERQSEKTVETGLYFDNAKGEGFFAILHPIMHPMETVRGIAKHAQGEPDELTARRVGLSHLKESLKDIYGGEIIVVGNADIRPHDLVYLADVYERMYGIFEVEQVVHHFTPETGFVTSITPNAFVTVNDPARWFLSSWIASHFSMQNLRNDTRLLLANRSNNSALIVNGDISIDSMADMLKDQMLGGLQYTHGHTALIRDIQANHLADSIPDTNEKIKALISSSIGRQEGGLKMAIFGGLIMPTITATATAGAFAIGSVVGTPALGTALGAITAAGGTLLTDAIWGGWRWIRNNVLDQHGCYIQYLSKNGQPMDAGLSSFQGMVVGKFHSKRLLPGILGVRTRVRTADGHAFVRVDDMMRSIGWREKEITDLVRQISLENAIVHAEVLKYSGIGPEKTGLNQFFKTIVKATHYVDGDTIDVEDILTGVSYRIRFDGIQTAELNKNNVNSDIAIINPNSPASQALFYTKDALEGKVFVLRISPNNSSLVLTNDDYEAGSSYNSPQNYLVAYTSSGEQFDDRYIATIFYRTDEDAYNSILLKIRQIFISNDSNNSSNLPQLKEKVKELLSPESPIYTRFDIIYEQLFAEQALFRINNNLGENEYIYFEQLGQTDPIGSIPVSQKRAYDTLVGMMILHRVYEKASEWPMAEWNEYYNDASPVTLNWELVVKGLAKVYTTGLRSISGPALYTPQDVTPIPREVER